MSWNLKLGARMALERALKVSEHDRMRFPSINVLTYSNWI
jgi:hypothetical protein